MVLGCGQKSETGLQSFINYSFWNSCCAGGTATFSVWVLPSGFFGAKAQLQTLGLKPNYKLWGSSPTTNFGAQAQLRTFFGLKPNYEPFWAKAQLQTLGLKPNYSSSQLGNGH
ncbi:hypothetical protein [Kamptonema formosum]|uniref:hypothetical protein n=1 Tax=Kamptonema formosum TaxID=331992 RepID=UPI00034A2C24|nr:hypothetical protein [Oscillatoria sp. PCC 10802]